MNEIKQACTGRNFSFETFKTEEDKQARWRNMAKEETKDETEEMGIQWKGKGETFQDMRILEKWDDGCENPIVDQRKAVMPRGLITTLQR